MNIESLANSKSLIAPTLDAMTSVGVTSRNNNNVSITQFSSTLNGKNLVNPQSPSSQAMPKSTIMYVGNMFGCQFYSPNSQRYKSPLTAVSPISQANMLPPTSPSFQYSVGVPSLRATPVDRSSLIHSSEGTPNRSDIQKTPKADKNSKGLRHFAMKVLQKVQSKGCTTYNEVADELVHEFRSKPPTLEQHSYDQKNIRRRVYDALNVLMAMNIIHKEKKEIRWVGLPTNTVQELQNLQEQRYQLHQSVKAKIKLFRDLIVQEVCLKNLVKSNEEKETEEHNESLQYRIELPFAIITTSNHSTVDCSVTSSRDDYYFSFEAPFEVYDESEIMKRLGYSNELEKGDQCYKNNLDQCKTLLPRSLYPYIDAIGCCPPKEFDEFILSHCHYLSPDKLKHLSPSTVLISQLIKSCNKRNELNLQFTSPTVTDVFTHSSTPQKKQ